MSRLPSGQSTLDAWVRPFGRTTLPLRLRTSLFVVLFVLKKLHRRASRFGLAFGLLLEFFRRTIAQRRVQPLPIELCLRKLQRSSCARPVRTDSLAASRISSTCTFNRGESGSSMGLSWRMQSTKYATGLLVAPCGALSEMSSPSNPDFPRSSVDL